MKNALQLLLIALTTLFLQSCVTTSSFQTARSMGQDEYGFSVGINLPQYEITIDSTTSDVSGFLAEARGRYGITERLDAGLKLSLIGTSGGDVKYQFLGDQNSLVAGSIGGEIGYASIEINDSETTILDLGIPTYFSIHPTPFLGVYVSPRYSFRSYGSGENNSYFGAVAGLRLGKQGAMFAEYAFLRSADEDLGGNHTQLNFGFGYNIK